MILRGSEGMLLWNSAGTSIPRHSRTAAVIAQNKKEQNFCTIRLPKLSFCVQLRCVPTGNILIHSGQRLAFQISQLLFSCFVNLSSVVCKFYTFSFLYYFLYKTREVAC